MVSIKQQIGAITVAVGVLALALVSAQHELMFLTKVTEAQDTISEESATLQQQDWQPGQQWTGYWGGANGDPCEKNAKAPFADYDGRPIRQTKDFVVAGAQVWQFDENKILQKLNNTNVYVSQGKITTIKDAASDTLPSSDVVDIIQANGRILTSGIVDVHVHFGGSTNEISDPVVPQVRVMDGFDVKSWDFVFPRQRGVTAVQVIPGSGEVMGGVGAQLKLIGDTLDDMYIAGQVPPLKMACGENPKRLFGNRGRMPSSRMGNAWVARDVFVKAKQLMLLQDQWCAANPAPRSNFSTYPDDIYLHHVLMLLRGQIQLHNHCYEVQDMVMMLKLSEEFGFKVTAFHHALEAWKIPDILKRYNVGIATFADEMFYKKEAYDASVHGVQILQDAGVAGFVKSDHGVTPSQHMVDQAGKVGAWGASESQAWAAVTLLPAQTLGYGNRFGNVKVGFDGDLVLWDRNPLMLKPEAARVWVDGVLVSSRADDPSRYSLTSTPAPWSTIGTFQCPAASPPEPRLDAGVGVGQLLKSYVMTGLDRIYTLSDNDNKDVFVSGSIVVRDDLIACIGNSCDTSGIPVDQIFDYSGVPGTVYAIPGFVDTRGYAGFREIGAETSTHDGNAYNPAQQNKMDGVRLVTRMTSLSRKSGVTTITGVSRPVVASVGGAVLAAGLAPDNRTMWSRDSFVQYSLGYGSEAHANFRSWLLRLRNSPETGPFKDMVNGVKPLVIHSFLLHLDRLAALIRLKNELGAPDMKWVLVAPSGEDYLLANELQAAGINLILDPIREYPEKFGTGALSNSTLRTKALVASGMQFGFRDDKNANARNMRWDAGMLQEMADVTFGTALSMGTSNIADMLNLPSGVGRIVEGTRANFAVYSENPLSYQSVVLATAAAGYTECMPDMY